MLPEIDSLEVAIYLELHYRRLQPLFASGEPAKRGPGDEVAPLGDGGERRPGSP